MPARITISIDDSRWPFLTIVSQLETADGQRTASTDKFQYDVAGSQAESISNNLLQRAITSVIRRRKQLQQQQR